MKKTKIIINENTDFNGVKHNLYNVYKVFGDCEIIGTKNSFLLKQELNSKTIYVEKSEKKTTIRGEESSIYLLCNLKDDIFSVIDNILK